jgi:hypothetical protein
MSEPDPNLYVSAVKGHLVTRFGTGLLIGATRDPKDPSKVTWDEDEIAKISPEELAPYRREYARALRDGALKKREAADFKAVNEKRAQQTETDLAKVKAEAAKQQKAPAGSFATEKKE